MPTSFFFTDKLFDEIVCCMLLNVCLITDQIYDATYTFMEERYLFCVAFFFSKEKLRNYGHMIFLKLVERVVMGVLDNLNKYVSFWKI